MGPAPSGRSGHAMAIMGTKIFVLGGESFIAPKMDDSELVFVLDTSQHISRSLFLYLKPTHSLFLEHIKYPPPDTPVPDRKSIATPPQNGPQTNGRPVSPNAVQSPEDPRRALSPTTSIRSNGMHQQAFVANKGKAPMRPRREDDDITGTDDGMDTTTSESHSQRERERVISPDQQQQIWQQQQQQQKQQQQQQQVQQRAKSPTQPGATVSRTVSPNGGEVYDSRQLPNMVGVTMGINGSATGRGSPAVAGRISPANMTTGRGSPAVGDRSRSQADTYASSVNESPALNGGFPHGNGSVGSVAADLVKDLKAKDAELEGLKRQMSWIKGALGKATKAGFVLSERQGSSDLTLDEMNGGGDEKAELLFKFKQFRAEVQVSNFFNKSWK